MDTIDSVSEKSRPACIYIRNKDFGQALHALLDSGTEIRRSRWPQGCAVKMQRPDRGSANTRPYLYYIDPAGGIRVPWAPSQEDLFAYDWTAAKAVAAKD